VDAQHRELMSLFNRLEQAEADGPAEVQVALGNLTEYTAVHFAMEEDLMRREEFPPARVAEHVEEHRRLTAEVRDRVLAYRAGELTSVKPIADFLHEWLRHHVAEMDRLLVEHCLGREG
jgi:hemerythrin-like metal-binding protein